MLLINMASPFFISVVYIEKPFIAITIFHAYASSKQKIAKKLDFIAKVRRLGSGRIL